MFENSEVVSDLKTLLTNVMEGCDVAHDLMVAISVLIRFGEDDSQYKRKSKSRVTVELLISAIVEIPQLLQSSHMWSQDQIMPNLRLLVF